MATKTMTVKAYEQRYGLFTGRARCGTTEVVVGAGRKRGMAGQLAATSDGWTDTSILWTVAPKYSVTYPAVPGAQPTTQTYDSLLAARAAAKVASQDRGDLRYQDVVIRKPSGFEYAGPVR